MAGKKIAHYQRGVKSAQRGLKELRGILGEKIKRRRDESGRSLWVDYSFGVEALAPSADLVVARTRAEVTLMLEQHSRRTVLRWWVGRAY
jgi:hypothetical protein